MARSQYGQIRRGFEEHLPHFASLPQLQCFILCLIRVYRGKGPNNGRVCHRTEFQRLLGRKASTNRALRSLELAGYIRIDEKGIVWLLNADGGRSAARPEKLREHLQETFRKKDEGVSPLLAEPDHPRSGRITSDPVKGGSSGSPVIRADHQRSAADHQRSGRITSDPHHGLNRSNERPRGSQYTISDVQTISDGGERITSDPVLPGLEGAKSRRARRARENPYPFLARWNPGANGLALDNVKAAEAYFETWARENRCPQRGIQQVLKGSQISFERHAILRDYATRVHPATLTSMFVKWVQKDLASTNGSWRDRARDQTDEAFRELMAEYLDEETGKAAPDG